MIGLMERAQAQELTRRLAEPRRFMQILAGPRQVGKTTLARQAIGRFAGLAHYATADLPAAPDAAWVEQQWVLGRRLSSQGPALLVLDEVHKVPRWSEAVKGLWDDDTFQGRPLHVVLLGSSQFLMQQGSAESLAGRFELIRVPHWSYLEMREAFGWDVERFIHFGGYPGAAALAGDEFRWRSYLLDSIIEPTLSRDVLQMARVDKPALLRRLFVLGSQYSGQVLSFQKMAGQLQDAGNTTTLAHYLALLAGAWLLAGLDKHAADEARARGSSPKLQVLNTALMTALLGRDQCDLRGDGEAWGRLVESAVGAHLLNTAPPGVQIGYWRERGAEVDFVLRRGREVMPIEVKSGRAKGAPVGLARFRQSFGGGPGLVVGTGGVPLEDFLSRPAGEWLSSHLHP